jgi:ABC-2 type transport system permease protein
MFRIFSFETYKIFRKWRSYIGIIVIFLLSALIETSLYFEGENYLRFATKNLSQTFVFSGNLLNGFVIANTILQALVIHIPFLVTLVAGDLLASESTAGTYRLLLTRPVSRFKIVTSKFFAGIFYVFILICWLAVLSIGIGCAIFGTGPLIVLKSQIIVLLPDDILWRFACAFLFALLSMSVVASLAFLFSSIVENAIGPIISTIAIIIGFTIISSIDVSFFRDIKPYLFTTYMQDWNEFFNDPVDWSQITKSAAILICHITGFFGITAYFFCKRDILN